MSQLNTSSLKPFLDAPQHIPGYLTTEEVRATLGGGSGDGGGENDAYLSVDGVHALRTGAMLRNDAGEYLSLDTAQRLVQEAG